MSYLESQFSSKSTQRIWKSAIQRGEMRLSMLKRVPWFYSLPPYPTHRGERDFMVLSELVAKLGRTSLCRQYAIMHMKEGDLWINPPPL